MGKNPPPVYFVGETGFIEFWETVYKQTFEGLSFRKKLRKSQLCKTLSFDSRVRILQCTLWKMELTHNEFEPFNNEFKNEQAKKIIQAKIATLQTNHETSWKTLLGRLWRLKRTDVFDNPNANPIPFDKLIKAGRTVIIDLSDTDSTIINNFGDIEHLTRHPRTTRNRL